MAIAKAFAASVAGSSSGGVLTTGAFDSTGYTHLGVFFKHEGAPTTLTPSDNKTSTVQDTLTKEDHTSGDLSGQMFVLKIGTAGAGHTVSVTPTANRSFRGLEVWLIDADSGTAALDAQSNAEGHSNAPDAGSLVTTGASVVSFLGCGLYNNQATTPGSGWTEDVDGSGRDFAGFSRGPETTTPINPDAGWGITDDWVACAGSVREVTGGATITGSGTPAAGSATTAGTAERSVKGTGTPAAQSATTAGTAERSVKGTGTPAAQAATTAGTAERSITGTGAAAATSATTAGTAERSVKGTGAAAAQSSTTAGTAERVITSSGTPAAQSATTAGTGQVGNVITGSGAPAAQSATVAGTAERVITGTGAAVAQASTAAGTAERTVKGTGTPAAQSATVVGIGSGVIVATVSGLILLSAAADPFVARDDAGRVLPNATLDFYLTGTTEPADSLPDGAHYVADVDGEFQIIELEAAIAYRVIHKTAEGTLRFDVDPYVCNCGELEPLFRSPVNRAFLANDRIASAATLTFDGTLYADGELSVPHPNPLTANAAGIFRPIYFDESQTYNITLKDAAGNVLDQFAPYVCECAAEPVIVTGSGAAAAQSATVAGTGTVEEAASFTRELFTGAVTTWAVPIGVTSIDILAVAPGGAAKNHSDGQAGAGGGGGVVVVLTCPVTPGELLSVTGNQGGVQRPSPLENLARGGDAGFGGEQDFSGGAGANGGANNAPLAGSTIAAGSRGGSGGGGGWEFSSFLPAGSGGTGNSGAGSGGNSSSASGFSSGGGGGGAGGNGTVGSSAVPGNGGNGIIPPNHSFGAWGTDIGESGYFGGGGGSYAPGAATLGSSGLGSGAANTGGGGTFTSGGVIVAARTGFVAIVYQDP